MKKFPVVEVFGPTIQGEGPDAGRPCHFVRLGGCDFRCFWCDSMHAVEPREVRKAPTLTATEIVGLLYATARPPHYVVLSGGNPALHELGELVDLLHEGGITVAVETQGSRWKNWLMDVDRLVVSPKPPSSGMATEDHYDEAIDFVHRCGPGQAALKIVVFDEDDYTWARSFVRDAPDLPLYLSVGTPVGEYTDDVVKKTILERYRWLCERTANDPGMAHAHVLPQLHVLAWGTKLGV